MPDYTDANTSVPLVLDALRPERYELEDLIRIMVTLRTPVTGCPWDVEQTFHTIAIYTIEEAYEVADAIERGDLDDLRDELGDLLLQVIYHARIAEEENAFAFADVVDSICRKMVRRHPHVFGDAETRAATQLTGLWGRIKAEEKAAKRGKGTASGSESVLDDVPNNLPALEKAVKLQTVAAKVGFDWPDVAPVLEKLTEEIEELKAAMAERDHAHIAEEFGDMLFVIANLARHLQLDPESALRAANAKFSRRFRHVETRLREGGRPHENVGLDQMDAWWDEAKAAEKKPCST